ncbi:hypothetical protein B0A55_01081 [Friedmanniomyces simplex]|uniref:Glucose-methanol-choline oxidoreductase N-terminal domain-containing protein n=1 Tax=Friedmanniomyces simplex TaxID=329884 RepID=A0A4U0Y3M2_9PEZI|nr:hypothetical protein B0A55_01081 [Friedmanniomyces simplex]
MLGSRSTLIVVGGGTAGNAVAARLSQYLPNSSVLVIEAGPYAPDEDKINIPGLKGTTLGTKYDWNFTSIPQPQLYNRTITQDRGKVLGGSSALNLLIWDRGSKPEYDAWGEVGNPGWNWKSMDAAMSKAENFTNPGPPIYTGHAGYGIAGPINAVVNKFIPVQQDTWIPTLENLGVPLNSEWLDGENVGVAYHSSSIDPTHYNRSYSAVEYLPRAGPNLEVWTNTEVAKVNLEEQDGSYVATGVTLMDGSTVSARKEVIVSGGTIKNPQLLELSGVGNSSILSAAGVAQKINLPGVGENLQDHPRIQASYQLKSNYTSFDKLKHDPAYAAEQLALYEAGNLTEYGYAASAYSYQSWSSIVSNDSSLVEAAKSVVASTENNVVDKKKLEFLTNAKFTKTIAQSELVLSDGYTGSKGYPAINTSLGYVHIKSDDASEHPAYNPAFASNEYDLQGLITIAKYIRKVAQTAPFSETWTSEYEPGLDVVQTEEEWQTYVLNNTQPFYHPVGTCAMLPREDGGVVDPSLMVYDTTNLRVVDASIIPILVSAHPQTGIYGVRKGLRRSLRLAGRRGLEWSHNKCLGNDDKEQKVKLLEVDFEDSDTFPLLIGATSESPVEQFDAKRKQYDCELLIAWGPDTLTPMKHRSDMVVTAYKLGFALVYGLRLSARDIDLECLSKIIPAVTDFADAYSLLPACANNISHLIFGHAWDGYDIVASNPFQMLLTACNLESESIYREAMKHAAAIHHRFGPHEKSEVYNSTYFSERGEHTLQDNLERHTREFSDELEEVAKSILRVYPYVCGQSGAARDVGLAIYRDWIINNVMDQWDGRGFLVLLDTGYNVNDIVAKWSTKGWHKEVGILYKDYIYPWVDTAKIAEIVFEELTVAGVDDARHGANW